MTGSLIQRSHSAGGIDSTAVYSVCERYRYELTRVWDEEAPRLLYVMLNPSTADETQNDPTIERCQRRAVRNGFGAMRICNLFAWREASPAALKRAGAPEGGHNEAALAEAARWANAILCAWGVHGAHRDAHLRATALLSESGTPLFHLGLTQAGHPRHPLYVSYDVTPAPWAPAAEAAQPVSAG